MTDHIELCRMKFGGWAWRCWTCDRNHFGYGDDETKARADASAHVERTHRPRAAIRKEPA